MNIRLLQSPVLLRYMTRRYYRQKEKKANEFLIKMFRKSPGFDAADNLLPYLIEPLINEFSLKELEQAVNAVNRNGQISSRRRAKTDNQFLKERILELDPTFSFTK